MDIAGVKETVEAAKKIVKEKGRAAIGSAFKALFEKWPKLESVSWTQYTPYFNDGDECRFSVHEFRSATYDGQESEEPAWDWSENKLDKALIAELKELQTAIKSLGSAMEDIFGNHAEVTAKPDGFTVEEHEHE